ncbi:MAG TPA: MFS transporter [Pyrinomonadaceae bacterium]|nr:MFS transporter [Pyrinomonadaceae bacterium]
MSQRERESPAAAVVRPNDAQRESKNDRREVFGWMMYDWANSAFSSTVAGVMLGQYVTRLAQVELGDNGTLFSFGALGAVTAKSFFPFCISVSVFLQVFLLPILGAIADYSNLKKRLLAIFCYLGVAATCLMFVVTGSLYVAGGILFIVANLSFGAALVFYNAFLPEITTEDERDKVSSRGYALGYLGGGLLLALNLLLVYAAPALGISTGMAVRLSLLSAGVWWGGFALFSFARLKTRAAERSLPPGKTYFTVGFSQLGATFRQLLKLKQTMRYLVGYLFFNDGIQTVISMAGIFLAQELFVSRGEEASESFLLSIFLLVQFLAFFGALLFERIANWLGTKRAIMLSLAIWACIVIYAYALLQTKAQAWAMASMIAIVLGGSQALSRSLFSRMIPKGSEASFFGLYEISERGTSWLGPLVFGIVVSATNSYRQAILSLIVFFVVGLIILSLTDTDKAIHDAGNVLPEEVERSAA